MPTSVRMNSVFDVLIVDGSDLDLLFSELFVGEPRLAGRGLRLRGRARLFAALTRREREREERGQGQQHDVVQQATSQEARHVAPAAQCIRTG